MSYEIEDFQQDVLESFQQPVLVDFWAEWWVPVDFGPDPGTISLEIENGLGQGQHRDSSGSRDVFSNSQLRNSSLTRSSRRITGALPEASIRQWLSKRCPKYSNNQLLEFAKKHGVGEVDQALLQTPIE